MILTFTLLKDRPLLFSRIYVQLFTYLLPPFNSLILTGPGNVMKVPKGIESLLLHFANFPSAAAATLWHINSPPIVISEVAAHEVCSIIVWGLEPDQSVGYNCKADRIEGVPKERIYVGLNGVGKEVRENIES